MALPDRRTRWDPFVAFDELHAEMSRILSSAFPSRIVVNDWSPPVDVEETEDAYLIEADMPGVTPDDVSVEVQGTELHISAKADEREPDGTADRRSVRGGHFDYRLSLPGEVASDGAEAELDKGVLKLRLTKTSVALRRRIPVRGVTADLASNSQA